MKPKISIVIPTWMHLSDCLQPCCESIIKWTDLSDVEVLVVANGCENDGTREYVESLGSPFRLIWIEEQGGYAKPTNIGMKEAVGDYIILLNNDTQLLPQPKNDWIKKLLQPFLEDETTGMSAPMKVFSDDANAEFLIFFCVMISRKVIDAIGYLDESFFAYSEDIDMCLRAVKSGFKLVQVPRDSNEYYDDKRMKGDYPIFHAGNLSFKNWEGGEELIAKNNRTIKERYNNVKKINIEKALSCDGYMSEVELTWLGKTVSEIKSEEKIVCIEIGSWRGRSSRAFGDNLPDNAVLFCVDTWKGSVTERDTNHASAKLMDGDHAYYEFLQNNFDLIQAGKIIPLRMESVNASCFFIEQNIKANFVFIDAGHEHHEVLKDIEVWKPIVKEGGILSGHDYYEDENVWSGVRGVKIAVDEIFGHKGTDMGYIEGNSIWRHIISKESNKKNKSNVYDIFSFNQELDILEMRFNSIFDCVDRFVIVESTKTHSGKEKPLHFKENLQRFEKYLHKVTHIVVDTFPAMDSWSIERHQRDEAMKGLTDCKDNDIIIVSDVDEIPNQEAIMTFRIDSKYYPIATLEMDLYYYNKQTKGIDKWQEAKIAQYKKVKELTPCGIRYSTKEYIIKNAGEHLSYFGDVDHIIKKIEATAHIEYDKPEYKDRETIKKLIEEGKDIFMRDNIKFEKVNG